MEIKSFEQKGSHIQKKVTKPAPPIVVENVAERRNSGLVYGVNNPNIWNRDLVKYFYENEFLPKKEKMTNEVIRERLMYAHRNNRSLRKNFRMHRYSLSTLRTKYNQSKLTSSQPRLILISLTYDENGYPLVGPFNNRFMKDYIFFMEVYTRCCELKIADPRFVPYEYIVEIRNRQIQNEPEWMQWWTPTDKEIKSVADKLNISKPSLVYNSVKFPHGFTREETPVDFVPFAGLKKEKKPPVWDKRGFRIDP